MKKAIVMLINLILVFCLTSCATVKVYVELSQGMDNVQSIEIYNSERAYYEGDIHVFLAENEPIAVVDPESHTSFLDALSELEFEKEIVFFPIPMDGGCDYEGYVIAVLYSDGGYDIIAEGGLYSYAVGSDGKARHKYDHSDYCGDAPWAELAEKYIEE